MRKIKKILPRHREIMRRLVWTSFSQREIAEDLGISESNLSVTINSPLFQMELAKEQARKDQLTADDTIVRIHRKMAQTTEKAIKTHDEILDNTELPLPLKQASATDMISLFIRSNKGGRASVEDLEAPYEKQLQEVIFRQETTRLGKSGNGEDIDAILDEAEADAEAEATRSRVEKERERRVGV